MADSRYVIGIDLGTTNTAIAYVDRRSGRAATRVRHFAVPQLTAPGDVRERRLLPSFVYLAGEHELPSGAIEMPFGKEGDRAITGELARNQGGLVPGRLVASSKSWLCHDRVDRRAAILPWHGAPDAPRISPVDAAAKVLGHLKDAWDHRIAEGDPAKAFTAQEVILCVPASFDAVARRLTLEAANAIGLAKPILLEEPQAALYAWIAAMEGRIEHAPGDPEGAFQNEAKDAGLGTTLLLALAPPGSLIFVVDVGGGTTDFALVKVLDDGSFERTAVSDHLLLGGDNMDLALARFLEPRVKAEGEELSARDWSALRYACRAAKEKLLEDDGPESVNVTIAGQGAKLVGGARTAELTRETVMTLAVEGFFPDVALDDTTPRRSRTGLAEIGLPFVADPAITRHMGAFLRRHAPEGDALARPTAVLFNGGVVTTDRVRTRVLDVLERWTGARPTELSAAGLDLAVARGAAYYGLVRRERGRRIQGGLGRAYYVGVDTGAAAPVPVCLTPRGLEAEKPVTLRLPMTLQANVPVMFPFYESSTRGDAPGALAHDARISTEDEEGDLHELPPLVTVLKAGTRRTSERKEIPVEIVARLSEVGVLELLCHATDGTERTFTIELSVRQRTEETKRRLRPGAKKADPDEEGATAEPGDGAGAGAAGGAGGRDALPSEEAEAIDPALIEKAQALLKAAFAATADPNGPLGKIGRDLEDLTGKKREGWSLSLCRALFEPVMAEREARKKSPEHEARFYNLAAFCLRPGTGATLDEHRVSSFWKVAMNGLVHAKSDATRLEWWIAGRRVAGGLTKGQQEQMLHRVRDDLLGKGGKRLSRQETAEEWRLAASLEHVAAREKEALGEALLKALEKGEGPPRWGLWALGRLGTRLPQYGPLNETVSGERAGAWVKRALPLAAQGDEADRERAVFAIVQMARLSGDLSRDVPAAVRAQAVEALTAQGARAADLRPLLEIVPAARAEQRLLFGDTVPAGLRLAEPLA